MIPFWLLILVSCIPVLLMLMVRVISDYRTNGGNVWIFLLTLIPLPFPLVPQVVRFAEKEFGLELLPLTVLSVCPLGILLIVRLIRSFGKKRPNSVTLCLMALPLLMAGILPLMDLLEKVMEGDDTEVLQMEHMEPLYGMLPDGSRQLCRFRLQDKSVGEVYVVSYLSMGNHLSVYFFPHPPQGVEAFRLPASEDAFGKPYFLLTVARDSLPEAGCSFSFNVPLTRWQPPSGVKPFSLEYVTPQTK